jgi:hypothetical protein
MPSLASDDGRDRVEMVRKLLFESSAAMQVLESKNQEALEKHALAVSLFERAAAEEDPDTRAGDLNKSVAILYEAVAATHGDARGTDKDRVDYENRIKSFEAMLDAHERIATEKGVQQVHDDLLSMISADTVAASSLFAMEDVLQARTHLDRAYEEVKLSVEHLRAGETLLRELKFDTPEDEYVYELDRNDTHRMLLTILLEEKMKDERTKKRVAPLLESADNLREEAKKLAGEHNFVEAIGVMERSTKEVVKAIRGAGVYIPG